MPPKSLVLPLALLLVAQSAPAESLTLVADADTGLFEFSPDNNLGGATALQIGTNSQGTHGRGLFRFPVADHIPAGARIDAVSVTLNVTSDAAGSPDTHDLRRVQLGWGEGDGDGNRGAAATPGQATWDARRHGQDQWTTPGGGPGTDFGINASASAEIGAVGAHTFASSPDLVSDVQRWLDHPAENFGWVLISQSEGSAGATRRIATRELAGQEPRLHIEFTPLRVIQIDRQADGQVSISWQGGSPPYMVEQALSPGAADWTPVATSDSGTADIAAQSGPDSFYRVRPADPPEDVRYRVTWTATWSSATHPIDFPGGAHFSALYGATHTDAFTMWEPGTPATPGIKRMAETGSNSVLRGELQAAQAALSVKDILPGSGLSSPGRTSLEFDASQSHPLVSLVCMIAPSPDWFVGVHGLALFENGQWLETRTISLQAYDSGTDSGAIYTSANAVTDPPVPISQITPSGETRPLGTLTFERIDP